MDPFLVDIGQKMSADPDTQYVFRHSFIIGSGFCLATRGQMYEDLDKELPPLPDLELLNVDMINNQGMERPGMEWMQIDDPDLPRNGTLPHANEGANDIRTSGQPPRKHTPVFNRIHCPP